MFIGCFMTSHAAPKQFDSLIALTKRLDKTLWEYTGRYIDTYNDDEDCTEKQAVSMFRQELSFAEKLMESLTMNIEDSFTKLMVRVEKHAKLEDEIVIEANRHSH